MKHTPSRKRWMLGAVLASLALFLTACAAPVTQQAEEPAQPAAQATAEAEQTNESIGAYQVITAQKAKQIMDNEPDVIIVDVREAYEYNEGHVPNALLLPLGDIEKLAATTLPDKDATLLVYCRSGARSQVGSRTLLKLGYTNVLDFGGIIDWPYDVVK